MTKKNLIYSTEIADWDSDEFRNDYQERYDLTDEEMEEVTDEELINCAYEDNRIWQDDERHNLNITLSNNIIVIADLGLWNGRRSGYKMLGNNINNVLNCSCGDFYEVYCDRYNVCATDSHHDGTNYYTFREVKEGVNIETLQNKIYNGTFTKNDISRYTRSIRPQVANVFGW